MRNKRALYFALTPALFLLFFSLGSRLMQSEGETTDESLSERRTNGASPAPSKVVPVDKATQKILATLVAGQLDAIRKKDYHAALEFAMPLYRRQWTAASFGRMVENGYSVMNTSITQRCQTAQTWGKSATMLVRIAGVREGEEAACVYAFAQSDGKWYITTCSPVLAASPLADGNTTPFSQRMSLHPVNGDMDSIIRKQSGGRPFR